MQKVMRIGMDVSIEGAPFSDVHFHIFHVKTRGKMNMVETWPILNVTSPVRTRAGKGRPVMEVKLVVISHSTHTTCVVRFKM